MTGRSATALVGASTAPAGRLRRTPLALPRTPSSGWPHPAGAQRSVGRGIPRRAAARRRGLPGLDVRETLQTAPWSQRWSVIAVIALGLVMMVIARLILRSPFFQVARESDSQPVNARSRTPGS